MSNEWPKVYRDGKLVPKYDVTPLHVDHVVPYVISDIMEPTVHMATGRVIDSKARFRAETRASNCVEIGNEKPKNRQPIRLDNRQRREDIKRAVYDLRNNRK